VREFEMIDYDDDDVGEVVEMEGVLKEKRWG
jgi:hypothetical protein